MTFAELLQELHDDKHTGAITIHLTGGVPVAVEFPTEPQVVHLDRRAERDRRASARVALDRCSI